jgi:hypothetical protein
MRKTSDLPPDHSTTVSILNSTEKIARQVDTVLGVMNVLNPYLIDVEYRSTPSGGRADGGYLAAAEVTFANACDRLDQILTDSARWEVDTQTSSEAIARVAKEAQEKHNKLLEAQAEQVRNQNRPCYMLRPSIYRRVDGKFAAVYGDIKNPSGCLYGIGDTPLKAMENFDRAYESLPEGDEGEPEPVKKKPRKIEPPAAKKQRRKGVNGPPNKRK